MENEVLHCMKTRFSCRKYKNTPVEKEKLDAILEAATYAASGHNAQGWYFTVIQSDEAKAKLLSAVGPEPPEYKKLAPKGNIWPFPSDYFGAPVVIMVSYMHDAPWADAGAFFAADHIIEAANALGLATCALTMYSHDVFTTEETAPLRKDFIPDGYDLYLTMVLGYPETIPEQRPKRREDVIRWL